MQHKIKLFVTASAAIVLCTTNVSAETTATQPPCKTEVECTKLSDALQVQIDELKSKGFRNLSKEEKIRYGTLRKERLAAMRAITAAQDKEIAEAKAKTAEAKAKTQAMYDELQETVKRIETTLK